MSVTFLIPGSPSELDVRLTNTDAATMLELIGEYRGDPISGWLTIERLRSLCWEIDDRLVKAHTNECDTGTILYWAAKLAKFNRLLGYAMVFNSEVSYG